MNTTLLLQSKPEVTTPIGAANNSPQYANTDGVPIQGANSGETLGAPVIPGFLDDAARRIREFEQNVRIDRIHAGLFHVGTNRIMVGNRDYTLDGDGFRRLCQYVGAPHAYLASLPPALLSELLKYHVSKRIFGKDRYTDGQATIISRGGRFLAFGRADLQSLTGSEVLSAVIDAVEEPRRQLELSRLSLTDESIVLEVVSRQVTTEVRPGDVICGGLRIMHSPLGSQATSILSFVLRLVCANGLVHRECVGPRKTARARRLPLGSKQAKERQMEQIHRLTRESWSHTRSLLDSIQHLQNERVSDPRDVFERYLRNGRLYSQSLLQRLREAWVTENSETTAFGVLNALTRVATHDTGLSQRQRRALAALAGIFAQKDTHICPHCFSVIPSAN